MKKPIVYLVLVTILIIMAACAKGPDAVAKKFLDAWEKNDTKTMTSLATEQSAQLIALVGNMKVTDIKIISTQIDGDKAEVKFTFTADEGSKDGDLKMIKKDGKWKVDLAVK